MRSKKILSSGILQKTSIFQRNEVPIVKAYICSQSLDRLPKDVLAKLANNYELLYFTQYLHSDKKFSESFLNKIFSLLFQLAITFYQKEVVQSFLKNYDFVKIIKKQLGDKVDSADKIIFLKISRFLNEIRTLSQSPNMKDNEVTNEN